MNRLWNHMLPLIRDVLDNELRDATDQPAGRVDGIVIDVRDGAPPRVLYVEVSPITAASRLSRRLGRWMARLDRHFGPDRGVPYRIPFSRLTGLGVDLKLDFRADETPIFSAERLLRRFISRIPGA
jgi:hypothetical protein